MITISPRLNPAPSQLCPLINEAGVKAGVISRVTVFKETHLPWSEQNCWVSPTYLSKISDLTTVTQRENPTSSYHQIYIPPWIWLPPLCIPSCFYGPRTLAPLKSQPLHLCSGSHSLSPAQDCSCSLHPPLLQSQYSSFTGSAPCACPEHLPQPPCLPSATKLISLFSSNFKTELLFPIPFLNTLKLDFYSHYPQRLLLSRSPVTSIC